MKINLLAVGKKMPPWVNEGFTEYARRLPKEFNLQLTEIPAKKRTTHSNLTQLIEEEGQALLKALPKQTKLISLDRLGQHLNTEELATKLSTYQTETQTLTLLVGGPEGLSSKCIESSDETWSLSKLTLPHPLVRVILAEQIYRAWSLLNKHPYHR